MCLIFIDRFRVPIVSAAACTIAENKMVSEILVCLGKSKFLADSICSIFHRKYRIIQVATFVPWVGTAIQIIEVYALGQLTIAFIEKQINVNDQESVDAIWQDIENDLWSGLNMVNFYEKFSGTHFPLNIRSQFIEGVDKTGIVFKQSSLAQELASKGAKKAGEAVKKGWGKLFKVKNKELETLADQSKFAIAPNEHAKGD